MLSILAFSFITFLRIFYLCINKYISMMMSWICCISTKRFIQYCNTREKWQAFVAGALEETDLRVCLQNKKYKSKFHIDDADRVTDEPCHLMLILWHLSWARANTQGRRITTSAAAPREDNLATPAGLLASRSKPICPSLPVRPSIISSSSVCHSVSQSFTVAVPVRSVAEADGWAAWNLINASFLKMIMIACCSSFDQVVLLDCCSCLNGADDEECVQ